MTQGASRFPIVQVLNRLMNDYGFTPGELVHAIGYRHNADKGLRRLNLWLENGAGHDRILKEISTVFPACSDELEKAIAATKAIKRTEAEANFLERCKAEQETFTPYLHAEGETTIPNGICIFSVTGGHERWTTIEIPKSILELPLDNQLPALPKLMLAYRRRYNGACPFFGKLVGFKFVRLLDYFQFDREGRLLEHVEKPFRHGECWVELR